MYKKKLIEVALPLEAINKEAAREKSIRHGHPSTLHLWWARRPLAAAGRCRWKPSRTTRADAQQQRAADGASRADAERWTGASSIGEPAKGDGDGASTGVYDVVGSWT